jgi:hypothetical protein
LLVTSGYFWIVPNPAIQHSPERSVSRSRAL